MKAVIIGSLILFGCLDKGLSQSLHSVDKEFKQTINWLPSQELLIVSEKATVEIKRGDAKTVSIKIHFSATHEDSLHAKRELSYMQYSISQLGNVIEIRNSFFLPANVNRIQSKLATTIVVEAPTNINLSIDHKYGDLYLTKLSGAVSSKIEYSDLTIDEFEGEMDLNMIYSELRSQRINATRFNCKGVQSKLWFEISGGDFNISGNYSDFSLKIAEINSLEINTPNSFILLRPNVLKSYNYKLKSEHGSLIVPKPFSKEIDKRNYSNLIDLEFDPQNPTIKVRTSFNTVHLDTN